MTKIKEGDLVYIHPTLFEDQKMGFVWKIETKLVKHVIDPRVPGLTKEIEKELYSVWVFSWGRSKSFLCADLSQVAQ